MKKLTAKQQNILDFIKKFSIREGMAPTVYEIAENLGVKSSTIFIHLRSLQRKNYITRTSQARSIRLVDHPKLTSGVRGRKAAFPKIPLLNHIGSNPAEEGCRLIPFTGENLKFFSTRSLSAVQIPEVVPEEKLLHKGDIATFSSGEIAVGDLVLVCENGKIYSASVAGCGKSECTVDSCFGKAVLPLTEIAGILVELRRPLSRF